MPEFLSRGWCGLAWSDWLPLHAARSEFQRLIPRDPGLYRVRVIDANVLAYVGQTGRDLRERSRALARHTTRSADDPPWNDPHTAAPGLWA